MTQPLLSVEELSSYLGVPVSTIYAWNSKGTGPKRFRLGRHIKYRLPDVDKWVDQQQADS